MHRCKKKFIFAVLFFAGINCNAQSQSAVSPVAPVSPVVPVPEISGINMPSVPQISSSASSGDFYRPGQKNKNTKKFYLSAQRLTIITVVHITRIPHIYPNPTKKTECFKENG